MSLKISTRSDIQVFKVLDILRTVNERVEAGEDIIHMEVGQPCVGVPQQVLDYIKLQMDVDPCLGYTEALGMTKLRKKISKWYEDYYELDVPHERIALTIGASGAFILAFLSIFEIGDKIAMTVPCYPPYKGILKSLGMETVELETNKASNYQPTVEALEGLQTKIQGLIITSPSNPTGTIIDDNELQKIITWCEDNNVWLISDEIYHGISFEEKSKSALEYSDKVIIINSFSKYFAMTGWRLGWLVAPEIVLDRVKRLAENLFISAPCISQHAAYKVFDHIDILDSYVQRYKRNLDYLRQELPKVGISNLSNTKGAFYLYADIHNLTNDSEAFCRQMLDDARVACTPGVDFDPANGNHTIRMSFAGSEKCMQEACLRLSQWLK